jgi:hypothetical protein
METRSASDVAQLPQNSKQFPEKHSCERGKIVRQASENKLSLAEMNLPIRSAKAGFEPLPSIRTC